MDVVLLPQLESMAGASAPAGEEAPRTVGHRFDVGTITDGEVKIVDRTITRLSIDSSDPLSIVFPPKVTGYSRNFTLRIAVSASPIPEVMFVGDDESLRFEGKDAEALSCQSGINVFSFEEMEEGLFLVKREAL